MVKYLGVALAIFGASVCWAQSPGGGGGAWGGPNPSTVTIDFDGTLIDFETGQETTLALRDRPSISLDSGNFMVGGTDQASLFGQVQGTVTFKVSNPQGRFLYVGGIATAWGDDNTVLRHATTGVEESCVATDYSVTCTARDYIKLPAGAGSVQVAIQVSSSVLVAVPDQYIDYNGQAAIMVGGAVVDRGVDQWIIDPLNFSADPDTLLPVLNVGSQYDRGYGRAWLPPTDFYCDYSVQGVIEGFNQPQVRSWTSDGVDGSNEEWFRLRLNVANTDSVSLMETLFAGDKSSDGTHRLTVSDQVGSDSSTIVVRRRAPVADRGVEHAETLELPGNSLELDMILGAGHGYDQPIAVQSAYKPGPGTDTTSLQLNASKSFSVGWKTELGGAYKDVASISFSVESTYTFEEGYSFAYSSQVFPGQTVTLTAYPLVQIRSPRLLKYGANGYEGFSDERYVRIVGHYIVKSVGK